jgi:hypothetical protein
MYSPLCPAHDAFQPGLDRCRRRGGKSRVMAMLAVWLACWIGAHRTIVAAIADEITYWSSDPPDISVTHQSNSVTHQSNRWRPAALAEHSDTS